MNTLEIRSNAIAVILEREGLFSFCVLFVKSSGHFEPLVFEDYWYYCPVCGVIVCEEFVFCPYLDFLDFFENEGEVNGADLKLLSIQRQIPATVDETLAERFVVNTLGVFDPLLEEL